MRRHGKGEGRCPSGACGAIHPGVILAKKKQGAR
ncbi:hypothetical protein SAMN05216376_101522 [Mameliella alba]|nr:hypothetical protein SAMN05216376_101522 [Mameliella alba]